MDYETAKNVHEITPPQQYVGNVAISADGHIVGFSDYVS